MIYKLMLQNHAEGLTTKTWKLKPPAVVGRDHECELCIEHESISRKHCQFSLNGEEALVVKDLGSMNGTYVDDQRIQHATLMPGQTIQIGALILRIDFSTEDEHVPHARPVAKGSAYVTQPMATFRPVPLPPEKPWWRKLFG